MNEDELKLALKHVKRDERHLSNAETRYWCDQYKLLATQAIEALTHPKQEPMAWKVVPVKPTDEMLKAMDECSKEGYDEQLYAGHAASVYMAAVDAAPQRKPLTIAEVEQILAQHSYEIHGDRARYIVRMTEVAHGIGGQP